MARNGKMNALEEKSRTQRSLFVYHTQDSNHTMVRKHVPQYGERRRIHLYALSGRRYHHYQYDGWQGTVVLQTTIRIDA